MSVSYSVDLRAGSKLLVIIFLLLFAFALFLLTREAQNGSKGIGVHLVRDVNVHSRKVF